MHSKHSRLASLALGITFGLSLPTAQAQTAPAEPDFVENWRQYEWPGMTGFNGIHPVDIDSDGDQEFVFGSGSFIWGIGDYDEAEQRYVVRYQSPPYPLVTNDISAMRVIETGNTKYLWLGHRTGNVEIIDLLTREVVADFAVSSSEYVRDIQLVDGNNDSQLDVVVLAEDVISMYDPVSFSQRITSTHTPATRFVIGNIDADPLAEIVLNNGRIMRFNGVNAPNVRDTNLYLGNYMGIADIDADGRAEVIGTVPDSGGQFVRAYDLEGVTPVQKWSRSILSQYPALILADVQGDPMPEVLASDYLVGLYALNASDGIELWQAPSPGPQGEFAVFDADGDGQRELVWGSGSNLHVIDLATRTSEFESTTFDGPYFADTADVDDDGRLEIVTVNTSFFSPGGGDVVSVFDAQTHELEWRSDGRVFNNGDTEITGLRVGNVDGDPQLEIVASGTINGRRGRVFILDGISHASQGDWFIDDAWNGTSLDLADVDGDGDNEIVLSNVDSGTNFPGYQLLSIEPATGDPGWQTNIAGSSQRSVVQVVDSGAAGLDLLVANGAVTRVRLSDKAQVSSAATNYRSAAAANVDGAGVSEVIAGRADGTIDVLDGDTLALQQSFAVCPGSAINTIANLGGRMAAVTCANSLVIYDFDGGAQISSEPVLFEIASLNASLKRFTLESRNHLLLAGRSVATYMDVNQNRPPVIPAGGFAVHWRGSTTYNVNASDPDSDPLTYTIVGLPALGTASWENGPPGVLRYTANGTAAGADTVGVNAYDGSESTSANIQVTLTNSAPIASTSALSFHWRGVQTARLAQSDPDGDPVMTRIGSLPAHAGLSVTNASTGDIRMTPSAAFAGVDTFTYDAFDGDAASPMRSVQVTYTNASPAATTTALSFHWRGAQTATLAQTDPNGDPLLTRITAMPARGTLELTNATAGEVRFTPAGAFVGADSFAYDAFDGVSASAARTVQVNLTNSAPGAPGAIARDVTVGTLATGTLAATDANGDPLTYLVVTQPARGTLTLNATTGAFEYTPVAGSGAVTATVAASDGVSQSAAATLTFNYPAAAVTPPPPRSKKGGGALDGVTLLAGLLSLFALAGGARRRRVRRS